jgi:hypothetical protein
LKLKSGDLLKKERYSWHLYSHIPNFLQSFWLRTHRTINIFETVFAPIIMLSHSLRLPRDKIVFNGGVSAYRPRYGQICTYDSETALSFRTYTKYCRRVMAAHQPHFTYWGGGGDGLWHWLAATAPYKLTPTEKCSIWCSQLSIFIIVIYFKYIRYLK